MSNGITRRTLVTTGVATVAGAAGVGGAIKLMGSYGVIPPDHQGVLGVGKTLTYASQRLLKSEQALAREFPRSRISKVHPVNGLPPEDATYRSWMANGFDGWRLAVDGLVARPTSFSLDDLKRMPSESHCILHACEEGWSYIADWTGVRLSHVLEMVGTKPEARYVVFAGIPNPKQDTHVVRLFWDSIDMQDALHPQTLLAYGMNGEALPAGHGAPLRLRMGRQLGYKNVKYLARMTVIDDINKAFDLKRLGPWDGGI